MPRKKKTGAEKEIVSEEIASEEVIAEEVSEETSSEEIVTEEVSEDVSAEETSDEVDTEIKAEETDTEDGADTAAAPAEETTEPEVATGQDLPEAVKNLLDYLVVAYPESKFTAKVLEDQVKHIVVEFVMDEKIAFRQIVDINARIQTSKANLKGTVERNLSVYEKLSAEYLKKHNQTIEYMDQAEVKSIKTIKED